MLEAHGPGHIALSDNHAGEVIALPLQHGQSMWVKEHRFLTATTPPGTAGQTVPVTVETAESFYTGSAPQSIASFSYR